MISQTEKPAIFSIPATCTDIIPEKRLKGFLYGFHDDLLYIRADAAIGDVGRLHFSNNQWTFIKD